MERFSFFRQRIPGVQSEEFSGKLIVIEGADGVGRSTQIRMLTEWLEARGNAVLVSRMMHSALAGKGLRRAKKGTTLDRVTMALFYATDFADRLEHEIIPALKAGFVVLTDRYVYTLIARAVVRGIDSNWIGDVYGFALKPNRIFYLRANVGDLVARVLQESGFDYWESGMDIHPGTDRFDSFVAYQNRMGLQFDKMAGEYGFRTIDASRPIDAVFADLRREIAGILDNTGPESSDSIASSEQSRVGAAVQDDSPSVEKPLPCVNGR